MAKKIKIALFVPWLKSKGGVERVILSIMKNEKFDIDLYTLSYDKNKTFDEFRRFDINVIGKADSEGFLRKGVGLFKGLLLSRIKNLRDYDIFIISTAGIAEMAVFRNRHPVTVALTHTPLRAAHSMYDYYRGRSGAYRVLLPIAAPIYRMLEKRAWKHITYAIVLSEEVKRRLVDYKLIKRNRIFKIGPFADYPKNTRGKTDKIIVYTSRFTPYKRQDLAIRAFIDSDMPSQGYKLIVGGFIEDKDYFEKIKNMAKGREDIVIEKNMSENELKQLYRNCYATLFLAINEDTGLVPLESLSYGKPVIAVNEGGPKEFIRDGYNGLLVEATDTAIAVAMNKLLDKRYYSKLRRNAAKSPVFSAKKMMKNFDAAIESISRTRRK